MPNDPKPTRRMLDRLAKHPGWDYTLTRRKQHYRITGPNGALLFHGSSERDWRAPRNLRSKLRQLGAPV